jgi:hypothetical protein
VVALALAAVLYLVQVGHVPLITQPTACTVAADKDPVPLSTDQAGIAATIAGVAARRGLPARAVTVAYAAAMQESKLTNPRYGDRDSVGVFQQRPSEGWGPAAKIMDPVYATGKFFSALTAVHGYLHMPVYQAAQAVQHSADGTAYAQYATMAAQFASAFTGTAPHAVSCYYNGSTGKPRLAAAVRGVTGAFGPVPSQRAADPPHSHPTMDLRVGRSSEAWAVASWLIAHAGSYGITEVSYQGFQWRARKDGGQWVRQRTSKQPAPGTRAAARARAAAGEIVFG